MNLETAFKILDMAMDSSFKQIKLKYYALALQYHPDKNPEVNPDIFKKINLAFEFIRNNLHKNEQYILSDNIYIKLFQELYGNKIRIQGLEYLIKILTFLGKDANYQKIHNQKKYIELSQCLEFINNLDIMYISIDDFDEDGFYINSIVEYFSDINKYYDYVCSFFKLHIDYEIEPNFQILINKLNNLKVPDIRRLTSLDFSNHEKAGFIAGFMKEFKIWRCNNEQLINCLNYYGIKLEIDQLKNVSIKNKVKEICITYNFPDDVFLNSNKYKLITNLEQLYIKI